MIAFLRGEFVHKTPSQLNIEVNGVGYEVQISLHTYGHIQALKHGLLHIYFQVKEDGHTLFGFFDPIEKEMFVQLISISGVGASTARMMLSSMKPEEIAGAIAKGDSRQLENIKGIGKKTAERIVLELRDKIGKFHPDSNISPLINNTLERDALNALIALGISRQVAEQAVKKAMLVLKEPRAGVEEIIKQALKTL
jgi:Holliday junction DNA helicase RuvA